MVPILASVKMASLFLVSVGDKLFNSFSFGHLGEREKFSAILGHHPRIFEDLSADLAAYGDVDDDLCAFPSSLSLSGCFSPSWCANWLFRQFLRRTDLGGLVDPEHWLQAKTTASSTSNQLMPRNLDTMFPKTKKNSATNHRLEVVGAVKTWLQENEETRPQGPTLLRSQKLRQMLLAKKKMAQRKGGPKAIYAAIVLLTARNGATLDRTPQKSSKRGNWETWIEDSVAWMAEQGWITERTEQEQVKREATLNHSLHSHKPREHLIVDFGEGWRGVGWAIKDSFETIEVVGVDRRGFTYTGAAQGAIISAVNQDFTAKSQTGLLNTVAKKVGTPVTRWLMAWLSPECSAHSTANAMNQSKGAAHGVWAVTPLNQANCTAERAAQEQEYAREAEQGVTNLIAGLEANPDLLFALENPASSKLWNLPAISHALARNQTWRLASSGRPVRIRAEIPEANKDPNKYQRLDPVGADRVRKVYVHRGNAEARWETHQETGDMRSRQCPTARRGGQVRAS